MIKVSQELFNLGFICFYVYSEKKLRIKMAQRYPTALLEEFFIKNTQVISGTSMYIVRTANDEVCVRKTESRRSEPYVCTCTCFGKLRMCCHVVAVIVQCNDVSYLEGLTCTKAIGMSAVVGGSNESGRKPGAGKRRGGRQIKNRPIKANSLASADYILIRKSNRISVCKGCRARFGVDTRYVIRHNCSLPFPQKDHVTGDIYFRQSRPENHHFHVSRWCVIRDQNHKHFKGVVSLEGSLSMNNVLKELCSKGEVTIG